MHVAAVADGTGAKGHPLCSCPPPPRCGAGTTPRGWDPVQALVAALCSSALLASACLLAAPAGQALAATRQLTATALVLDACQQQQQEPRQQRGQQQHAYGSQGTPGAVAAPPLVAAGSVPAGPLAQQGDVVLDVSSDAEDGILSALRRIELDVESAVGAVSGSLQPGVSDQVRMCVGSAAAHKKGTGGGGYPGARWMAMR